MYILKVAGKMKIPDYIQIRDEQFALLAYFRADRPEDTLRKLGWLDKLEKLKQIIASLPYGKVQKLEW